MTEHPLGHVPDQPTTAPDTTGVPGFPLSIDEILASARRVERTAYICLRGDLEAEHQALVRELATIIDADGKVIVDPEASIGEQTAVARAEELNARLNEVNAEMRDHVWAVKFRAMDSASWAVFYEKHFPKADGADVTDFNSRLIVECAIEPRLTPADVAKARGALSPNQMASLERTALAVCTQGGLDVPKLPSFSRGLPLQ